MGEKKIKRSEKKKSCCTFCTHEQILKVIFLSDSLTRCIECQIYDPKKIECEYFELKTKEDIDFFIYWGNVWHLSRIWLRKKWKKKKLSQQDDRLYFEALNEVNKIAPGISEMKEIKT